jgi:ABC-type polysaccharide/polyol phosphate transport system ATPase subunit
LTYKVYKKKNRREKEKKWTNNWDQDKINRQQKTIKNLKKINFKIFIIHSIGHVGTNVFYSWAEKWWFDII